MSNVVDQIAEGLGLMLKLKICAVIAERLSNVKLALKGTVLARVIQYKYLGVQIAENDFQHRAIAKNLLEAASRAWGIVPFQMKNSNNRVEDGRNLFTSIVRSHLDYSLSAIPLYTLLFYRAPTRLR